MRVCILETDRPEGDFLREYGTYAEMFRRWLAPAMPEACFEALHVAEGTRFPEDAGEFDGYLITGARAGVYDDEPWIAPLIVFLQRLRAEKRPVTGICFGHQIMAQAYGGEVRKSDGGWIIGRAAHALTTDGQRIFGTGPLWQMSVHQDQVIVPPPTARRLVQNELSPNGGFIYTDFPGISLQFHPEYDRHVIANLLDTFSGSLFPAEISARARADLDGPLDSARVAQVIARVLSQHAR